MSKRWWWIGLWVLACGAEPALREAAPPDEQEAPRADEDPRLALHFARLEPDDAVPVSLFDGRVVIAGVTTDITSEVPNRVYPIAPGYDLVIPQLAVWDRAAARATRFPDDVTALEVAGVGWVLARRRYGSDGRLRHEIGDLDPQTHAYRALHAHGEPLGLYRGGLLVNDGDTLLVVRPARAPEVLAASLDGRSVLSDPLRGHRLLAARFDPTRRSGYSMRHADRPLAAVAVLDLERGTWRELGSVEGCVYALHMNCCDEGSMLQIRWASTLPASARPSSEQRSACAHAVLETDESLHALPDAPR
jgi:hypothetical protein